MAKIVQVKRRFFYWILLLTPPPAFTPLLTPSSPPNVVHHHLTYLFTHKRISIVGSSLPSKSAISQLMLWIMAKRYYMTLMRHAAPQATVKAFEGLQDAILRDIIDHINDELKRCVMVSLSFLHPSRRNLWGVYYEDYGYTCQEQWCRVEGCDRDRYPHPRQSSHSTTVPAFAPPFTRAHAPHHFVKKLSIHGLADVPPAMFTVDFSGAEKSAIT